MAFNSAEFSEQNAFIMFYMKVRMSKSNPWVSEFCQKVVQTEMKNRISHGLLFRNEIIEIRRAPGGGHSKF